jgi:hypothetical protein
MYMLSILHRPKKDTIKYWNNKTNNFVQNNKKLVRPKLVGSNFKRTQQSQKIIFPKF